MEKKGDIFFLKNDTPGETDIFFAEPPAEIEKKRQAYMDAKMFTVVDFLKERVALTPKAIALEEKKGDKWATTTFEDMLFSVECLSRALIDGKFCPETVVDGGKMKFLGCFLHNRTEAVISDFASFFIGVISISLFEEPVDHLQYLLNECPFESIVIQPNYAKVLIDGIEKKTTRNIKNFIMTEEPDKETMEKGKSLGIAFFSFKELLEKGKALKFPLPKVGPKDLGTFIMTSGSTGMPKASLIYHVVFLGLIIGHFGTSIGSTDSVVVNINYGFGSIKLAVFATLIKGGKCIFFGSQMEKTFEVIRETNPTFMIFPPIFMHKAYPGILESLNALPPAQKEGLLKAIQAKIQYMKAKKVLTHPELDKHLAGLRQKLFGSNMKICYYVGASMRDDILWFYRAILGVPFVSIYGLTESGGWCSMSTPFCPGNAIGAPLPGFEIKLKDCKDKGYTTKDIVDGKLAPRGEILIRSKSCFVSYFKEPEKSKEVKNEEGWVMTKDIAQLNLDNLTMTIIDRANNIKKLSNEEFIAAELLEKFYEESEYIAQMYIHVESSKDFLVAVAYANPATLAKWGKAKGLTEDFKALCKNPELMKEVLTDLNARAAKKGLNGYEHIAKIYFAPEPFSQANGFLTFTFKLRRPNIVKQFEKEIKEMYGTHP